MRLGQDVLSNLEAASAREWMLASGLGDAASGTAVGAHTRRSHALLLASDPHGAASVVLLKVDERLQIGNETFELACNLIDVTRPNGEPLEDAPANAESTERPSLVARPAGHHLLQEFYADPWPTWRWQAGGATIEKSLTLVDGHHAVAIVYRHTDGPAVRLSVSPLVAHRPPDQLQRESETWRGVAQAVPGRVRVETTPGGPVLSLWHGGAFMPARVWQRGLAYPADREHTPPPGRGRRRAKGEAPEADAAFVPGYLECELPAGGTFHVVASVEPDLFRALAVEGRLGAPPPRTLGECVELLQRGERDRVTRWRKAVASGADATAREAAAAHGGDGAPRPEPVLAADDPWLGRLSQALMDGLARRGGRATILTALPAGAERGAETLQACGALVSLRQFAPARAVLGGYIEYLNEGLAPQGFEIGTGRPLYGDPAPALWLVHALELLTRRSEDLESLRDPVLPAVESIVRAYRAGTRHGIRVDEDGLLAAGEGAEACRRADVNALWFHALVAMAQLARLAGRKENAAFYLAWAREHQGRVIERLWDEKRGCLFEALTPEGPRRGLAPSQLLAVSLSPPLLPLEHALRLVGKIERELLTPVGLRHSAGATTASPAWLGPMIAAHLRVHQRGAESQARAHGWIASLREHLDAHSSIHVPESIAAPRRGDGAARRSAPATTPPAPASVLAAAELLRVWIEEMDHAVTPAGVA